MTAPNAHAGEADWGSPRDTAVDSRPSDPLPAPMPISPEAGRAGLPARPAPCAGLLAAVASIQWAFDAEGRYTRPDPCWEAFTGQDHPAARDEGWLGAIHPDDREATVAAWRRALSTEQPIRLAHRVRRHDGVFRWMEM